MKKIWLSTEIKKKISPVVDPFDFLMSIQGEIFRKVLERETLRFGLDGETYFIKKHFGCGFWEAIKNLLQFRVPILGAKNELEVIRALEQAGVPTMQVEAYGFRGIKPFWQQSFIVTRELKPIVGLRDLAEKWAKEKPAFHEKKAMIEEVGQMAGRMHRVGVVHRDFYLAHFQLEVNSPVEKPKIYLIDLHRSIIRKPLKKRWIIKDLSSLYFSSMDAGLTKKDIFRFLMHYFNLPLSIIYQNKKSLLLQIEQKAKKLYATRAI